MTLLHVTDFHFNKSWFYWLLHSAPANGLVVLTGDLLDRRRGVPLASQIDWVSGWLRDFPRPLCVCSGDHDREWDARAARWTPAYWLRDIGNPLVSVDGQRTHVGGLSLLSIGGTTQPKGGAADIWAVHEPAAGTLVALDKERGVRGDPSLMAAVERFSPRLVLSGHVARPARWRHHVGRTMFLNPGSDPEAVFPNHILVHAESLASRLVTDRRKEHPFETVVPMNSPLAEAV